VRVLPKWTWTSGALSFVYPGQRFVPANVRAFIDTAVAVRDARVDCAGGCTIFAAGAGIRPSCDIK
jgi:hypothetical protein